MSAPIAGGTAIEWCDFTFNPWWGCEKISPGCAHCYADTLARRRAPGQELWGAGHEFRFFGDGHWQEPLRWARNAPAKLGRRPRVFCASMADVFEDRPELDEQRERLFLLIEATPELDWLLLTKRPEAMRNWLGNMEPAYPNVWLGVSIENARHTYRADVLREIPAAVRFISAEPLLGSLLHPGRVTLDVAAGVKITENYETLGKRKPLDLTGIDWLIVGGESGPGARPMDLAWARELVSACRKHDVAPFVKQLGGRPVVQDDLTIGVYKERPLRLRDRKGGDPAEWPEYLRIREWPRSAA